MYFIPVMAKLNIQQQLLHYSVPHVEWMLKKTCIII